MLLGLLLGALLFYRQLQGLAVALLAPSYARAPLEDPRPEFTGPDAARPRLAVRLEAVASGLDQPTDLAFTPDGRMLVLEKGGRLVEIVDGKPVERLKLEVRTMSELGLLGIALHPGFAQNGRFYLNWNPADGEMRTAIQEFHWPDCAAGPVLLELAQPYPNHNAGGMTFGLDGRLYAGTGDGGFRGDPGEVAQDPTNLLGKLLAFDVDKPGQPPEIWALGLRNPWKITTAPDGRILAADVGQDRFEEVDLISRGQNLGWDEREGRHCFEPEEGCKVEGMSEPIHEYGRDEGQSITGGVVWGELYLFADFIAGRIWAIPWQGGQVQALGQWGILISTFAKDPQGNPYVVDFGGGVVYKISRDAAPR